MTAVALAPVRRASYLPVVAGLLLGGAWYAAAPEPDGSWLVFAVAAAVGELLVIEDARGRTTPTSVAVIAVFALLENAPWLVAAVAASGWLVAGALRRLRRQPTDGWEEPLHRLVAAWSLAGLAALGAAALPTLVVGDPAHPVHVGAALGVAAGLTLGPPLWWVTWQRPDPNVRLRDGIRAELATGWRASVALAASAALAAVAFGLLGHAALLLMLLPVLAARAGLHRYAEIRRTYDQTVVAMSRMTELTGHVASGHGVRVAGLAATVARELGLGERDVALIERAAHLHELGRIATDDPDVRAHDREVAVAGAAILREAGDLDAVAELIAAHRTPYRVDVSGSEEPSLPARIVRAACDFDRLAAAGGDEGLERLRSSPGELDPRVVGALVRVVRRTA